MQIPVKVAIINMAVKERRKSTECQKPGEHKVKTYKKKHNSTYDKSVAP